MLENMVVIDQLTMLAQEVLKGLPVKKTKLRAFGSGWHEETMTVFIAAIETEYHKFFISYHSGLRAVGNEVSVSYINPSSDRVEALAYFREEGIGPKLHHLFRNLTCCEYCAKRMIRE